MNETDAELQQELIDHMNLPGYVGLKPNVVEWSRAWLEKAVMDLRGIMAKRQSDAIRRLSNLEKVPMLSGIIRNGRLEPLITPPPTSYNSIEEIEQLETYLKNSCPEEGGL